MRREKTDNDSKLSAASQTAYERFQDKLADMRAEHGDNPDASRFFDEIDQFFTPLFSQLVTDMKHADSIAAQKELLLQMMRTSFNEQMMVSGRNAIGQISNEYIKNLIDANTHLALAQADKKHAQVVSIKDPGGVVQAIHNYMGCLNFASESIDINPAAYIRREEGITSGPVTDEQRDHLHKKSEHILRQMFAPFITSEMKFQPDMIGVFGTLMLSLEHVQQVMNNPLGPEIAPQATLDKWARLQREYPQMASNVSELVNASIAARGRGRGTVQ